MVSVICKHCGNLSKVTYKFTVPPESIISQVIFRITCPNCHQLNEYYFSPKGDEIKIKKHGKKQEKQPPRYAG